MATRLEVLQNKITIIESHRQKLFKQKEPIDKKLVSSNNELQKLREEYDTIVAPTASWDWLLDADNGRATSAKNDALQKKLTAIGFDLFAARGYWPETNQVSIRIALKKDDSSTVSRHLNGIQTILSHIKPHGDGNKHFEIREHTCAEYGGYSLSISETSMTTVLLIGAGCTFFSLEEALQYIHKYHYCE